MRQSVIAFVGISGVGKSTLLNSLTECLEFQHLQASQLIKTSKEKLTNEQFETDELRTVDIQDNQTLLVEGFNNARDAQASLVVIDGHTLIDAPSGLVVISPTVFQGMGVTSFIFLSDNPNNIFERRKMDKSRNRPFRTPEQLEEQQEVALLSAFRASTSLKVPLLVFSGAHFDDIRTAISSSVILS